MDSPCLFYPSGKTGLTIIRYWAGDTNIPASAECYSEFVSVLHVTSHFAWRLIFQTIIDGIAHNPEGVFRVSTEGGIDAQ